MKEDAVKRIALVVDDEPAIRELISMVLQKTGFLTITACSAREALELSAGTDQRIDVLVSDVELGDGNGIDVAARIQSSRGDMEVLIISGKPDYQEEADSRQFAFLPKPFLPRQLLTAVDGVITRRQPAVAASLSEKTVMNSIVQPLQNWK